MATHYPNEKASGTSKRKKLKEEGRGKKMVFAPQGT